MVQFNWSTLGNISTIIGILSAVFSFFAMFFSGWQRLTVYREKKRLNQEIFVHLRSENGGSDKDIRIPFTLRRGEINRSEILGLIGMIPMIPELKQPRYKIHYLSTEKFRKEISRVQDASGEGTLDIICTSEELAQFDKEKVQ